MTYVLGLVVGGLVIGALARLIIPGRQPLGCLMTTAVGIGGSLLGGLIGRELFDDRVPGFLLAVAAAAGIVFVISRR